MFELETAIIEWRKQMQADGITAPLLLNELEGHLREEIQEQIKSGMDEQRALEHAIACIGHAQKLRSEFINAVPENSKLRMANRTLAVLWLAGCLVSFNTVCRQFVPAGFDGSFQNLPFFYFNVLATFIYLAGILGGTLLFLGIKWGAQILRTVALLFVIACVAQMFDSRMKLGWSLWCGAVAVFSLITIGVLHKFPITDLKRGQKPQ